MQLKVASYNIHKGIGSDWRRSPERILAVLAEIDADVVVLQEADRRFGTRRSVLPPALIAAHSPYQPVVFETRVDSLGWHGNAVLVRRPASVSAATTITLPSLEPRGSVAVEMEYEGLRLRVVGMHLDLTGLRRRKQAQTILAHIATRPALPTIIMGDTNEWRQQGGCLAMFHAHYATALIGPSFPAIRPVLQYDRLLVGNGFKIVDAGIHRSRLAQRSSDHLPVWAQLAYHNED